MVSPSAKRIDDVGAKIGGARKDRFAKGILEEDLATLDPAEAHLYVTKDNAWPAPDYAALVEGGMPVEVAALVKVVRDRLAARPDLGRDPRQAEGRRRDYVRMMRATKGYLEAVKGSGDMVGISKGIMRALGYVSDDLLRSEARDVLLSVYKDTKSPFEILWADRVKAGRMVQDGFPGKVDPALKGIDVKPYGEGFMVSRKGALVTTETFASVQAAHDWLRTRGAKASKADPGPKTPTRPHLIDVVRTGLRDVRGGRSVSASDFMATFGFRGVEFGNWLPGDERQAVLDLGYDALVDLADTLGVPPTGISLDGRLGLAFGARGSGAAAAHYEPTYRAVNLTRLSGAGSLAHEWFHALDHYAGEVDVPVLSGQVRSATGWRDWTVSRLDALRNLSGDEAQAWDRAVLALRSKSQTVREAADDVRGQVAELEGRVDALAKEIDRHDDGSARARVNLASHRAILEDRRTRLTHLRSLLAKYAQAPSHEVAGNARTTYLREAVKLCGKSGDYWKRPTEMGARAFEAAVFDGLAEKGGASPYLVQGVEGDRFEGPDYKGNPYPTGTERKVVCEAVMSAVQAMAARLGREPETPLTP